MKHTPAPWNVVRMRASEDTHHHEIHAKESEYHRDVVVCECFPINDDGQTDSESSANARLIAAAPELLEALEALMKRAVIEAEKYTPDGSAPIWAYIDEASNAISKARKG